MDEQAERFQIFRPSPRVGRRTRHGRHLKSASPQHRHKLKTNARYDNIAIEAFDTIVSLTSGRSIVKLPPDLTITCVRNIQQSYVFSMRKHHLLFLVLLGAMLWSTENWAKAADPTVKERQLIHTPKPGSPERQAICDGARPYVVSNYATAALPQPIVFKISHLSVQEPYCNLEAIPLFKDGSNISTEYIADIALNFCMKETGGTWEVIVDLSRTDVPDTSELRKIRATFPQDFPLSLLSPSWRQWLQ
jgi:hypothetical protein